MQYSKKSFLTGFVLFWTVLVFIPASVLSGDADENYPFGRTAHARMAVEQAWETYHDAALGGTLVSPTVQTELEMNLHKSRSLLAEAYDAEERGDMKTTGKLIDQIMQITKKVITESQEQKR